jgi:preprotein translocase subunit SecG
MLGGVQKTTDFLDKSTWTLATILIVLIMASALSFTSMTGANDSKIINSTDSAAPKSAVPTPTGTKPSTVPTPSPAQSTPAPVPAKK